MSKETTPMNNRCRSFFIPVFGNLEEWQFGDLVIWENTNLVIWENADYGKCTHPRLGNGGGGAGGTPPSTPEPFFHSP